MTHKIITVAFPSLSH